jgi:hypothetical protein
MVEFVAMATPEDLRIGAEYIKLADAYEEVIHILVLERLERKGRRGKKKRKKKKKA